MGLLVEEVATDAAAAAIRLTAQLPRGFGDLASQIKRAATSVLLNIAVGYWAVRRRRTISFCSCLRVGPRGQGGPHPHRETRPARSAGRGRLLATDGPRGIDALAAREDSPVRGNEWLATTRAISLRAGGGRRWRLTAARSVVRRRPVP